jgi:predicted RNA-binding Zn-ribbon protein involved in translation (DUF1610 family)
MPDTPPAVCSGCGYEFPTTYSREPCPKCGDTRRTFARSLSDTVSVTASFHGLAQGIRREWSWPWVAATICLDLVCLIVAFFASGWVSVAASAVFIIVTSFTGYKAFQLVRWETRF